MPNRPFIVGNWKMNGTVASLSEVAALLSAHPAPGCEMLLCPPATLVSAMAGVAKGCHLLLKTLCWKWWLVWWRHHSWERKLRWWWALA